MAEDRFLLGVHVSISGGVHLAAERAAALRCTTFQIFPSNPRGWQQKPLDEEDVAAFRDGVRRRGLEPFFVHMPYLPNLASPDDELYEKSTAALVDAVTRTARLGGRYLITHLGSHRGAGLASGRKRAAAALRRAVEATPRAGVTILMENSAGKSNQVGTTFQELTTLYKKAGKKAQARLGLCVDTCHGHVMGYDLSPAGDGLERILAEVDEFVGINKIKIVHLNDAKAQAGSGLDRHEHIGLGTIGREGFKKIINHPELPHLPMVLETPQEGDWDRKNLRTVRRLRE
ncbi:MAG: deoxyribonuclease IV [candidate division Zixibacteria bacterium]|nr:deoxyribonuclease IV [candidate division Zixibacteria bacterium]